MQKSPCFKAFWLIAAVTCLLRTPAQAQQLIVNGGFEAGLTGWMRLDQLGSDGSFFSQTGTDSPVNALPVAAPPQGTQAAMTDAQAGGSHVLFQDFFVPLTTTGGTIGFSLYINSQATFVTPASLAWDGTNRNGGLNLNQQARVDILTNTSDPLSVAPGDVLQNLYQTNTTDPTVSGYTNIPINISALLQSHQGQTLRLRFAEVDNVNIFNFGVDGVSIQAVPEPSALMVAGVGLIGLTLLRRRHLASVSPV